MKLLFVLMLSVSSLSAFAGEVTTADGSAIMCQTEQAKVATGNTKGSDASGTAAVDE